MTENTGTSNSGLGLAGVLFCIFLVLKLTGVIDWSWWLVTGPLWFGPLMVLVILGAVVLMDKMGVR